MNLSMIYHIIISEWEILKDKPKTYNILQSLAMISKGFSNLPKDRVALLEILKNVQIKEEGGIAI